MEIPHHLKQVPWKEKKIFKSESCNNLKMIASTVEVAAHTYTLAIYGILYIFTYLCNYFSQY